MNDMLFLDEGQRTLTDTEMVSFIHAVPTDGAVA